MKLLTLIAALAAGAFIAAVLWDMHRYHKTVGLDYDYGHGGVVKPAQSRGEWAGDE